MSQNELLNEVSQINRNRFSRCGTCLLATFAAALLHRRRRLLLLLLLLWRRACQPGWLAVCAPGCPCLPVARSAVARAWHAAIALAQRPAASSGALRMPRLHMTSATAQKT